MAKNIFDYSHVKSVTAWALIDAKTNESAGKVIANYSDNPNGSVCTCQVIIWNARKYGLEPEHTTTRLAIGEDFTHETPCIAKAGGYGYCKFSQAFQDAVRKGFKNSECRVGGRGEGAVREWLEEHGLRVFEVI